VNQQPTNHDAGAEPGQVPEAIDALLRAAFTRFNDKQFDEAEALCLEAVGQDPEIAVAWQVLAQISIQKKDLKTAADRLDTAAALDPGDAQTHFVLGDILTRLERQDEAMEAFRAAAGAKPDMIAAHMALARLLTLAGQPDQAADTYRRILELKPSDGQSWNNLGVLLKQQEKFDEAEDCYRRAAEATPNLVEPWSNLGDVLTDQGKLDDAVAAYDTAISVDATAPKPRFRRGCISLLRGDFTEGWKEYEWRWNALGVAPLPPGAGDQPQWDGGELKGKTILLWSEQGLGDTLQFIRYAPLVAARGGRVIVLGQPPLVDLLRTVDGVESVFAPDGPLPGYDMHAPLMSLPLLFGTTLENIPASTPYFSVATDRLAGAVPKADGNLRIGLVWSGNTQNKLDRFRSVEPAALRPLLERGHAHFYSLQVGPAAQDLGRDGELARRITDLSGHLGNFLDTAAVIRQLDLVISVDTAVAHVAGALGAPIWLMTPWLPDFRWLLDRADSPWYPSMRLFRQNKRGEWGDVVKAMAHALDEFGGAQAPST